jgi:hypothetical protein
MFALTWPRFPAFSLTPLANPPELEIHREINPLLTGSRPHADIQRRFRCRFQHFS